MAVLEHVEVKIISTATGERLKEYDDPDPEAVVVDGKIQKCIEAESRKEFKIEVTLESGFDYCGADGIYVNLKIDGKAVNRNWFKSTILTASRSHGFRASVTHHISTLGVKREEGWKKMSFAFGEANCWSVTNLSRILWQLMKYV